MNTRRLGSDTVERDARATASMRGLACADAYGNQFFDLANWGPIPCPGRLRQTPEYPDGHVESFIAARLLPDGRWPWTDDSEMAFGILAELRRNGEIDQDTLARSWAAHFQIPRDYGGSALDILERVRDGADWRPLSHGAFDGGGSLGNGSAMRIAPLGAWFADDLEAVVAQAKLASEITHAHPDGLAGGIAIATAAALAARGVGDPTELLSEVIAVTPPGEVHAGLTAAMALPADVDATVAATKLGNGRHILAPETVPLCVWTAARNLGDYPRAVRTVVALGGDIDTNAAIVGGIVAAGELREGIPASWLAAREPDPQWLAEPTRRS